jgi:Protein of unknown function, DUF481
MPCLPRFTSIYFSRPASILIPTINRATRIIPAAALLAVAVHVCIASTRTKTDVVYMLNGDKITCEIKSLTQGQLTVNPDYTRDNIVIDWTKVARLESTQQFVVTDPHGAIFVGALAGDPRNHSVIVVMEKNATLPQDSVIEIDELGSTFIRRLSGNITLGATIARADGERNFSLQTGVIYRAQRHYGSVDSNTQFSTQKQAPSTNETSVKTAAFQQLRMTQWYAGVIANFLSSSEQQIALQSTYGAAIARRLIFTNKTNLNAIGGLGYTLQQNASGSEGPARKNSLDSAFAIKYSTFRFDKATFSTALWLYPSLSSPGHLRLTLNQNVYYKFVGNLYVSVNFWDNFDNQPVPGAPENNLGATTGVGWSFP